MQLGVDSDPVNLAIYSELEVAARASTPAVTLATLDAITEARTRIDGNVAPALALEAMLVTAVRDTTPVR
jgi:DNA polymerase-3 subunit delta'